MSIPASDPFFVNAFRLHIDLPPNVPHCEFTLQPQLASASALYLMGFEAANLAISASDPNRANAPTTADIVRVTIGPNIHTPTVIWAVPRFNLDNNAAINNPKTGSPYFASVAMAPDQSNPLVAVNATSMPATTGVANGFVFCPGTTATQTQRGYVDYAYPIMVCAKLPDNTNTLVVRVDDVFGRAITFDRLYLQFAVAPVHRPFLDTSRNPAVRSAVAAAYF